jgi:hypothetical protein
MMDVLVVFRSGPVRISPGLKVVSLNSFVDM